MFLEVKRRLFRLIWKYTERRKGFEEWDDTGEDDWIFIKRISTANPISACSILLKELKSCRKNTLYTMCDSEND